MEETAVLKKINFFKDLSSWELMQVNKLIELQLFKAGEHIVKEGTKCDAFYIIKTGTVKVEKEGREIATLGSEEPIGEVSFIDSGVRSATITALQDTVVIKLPSDKFKELLSHSKEIANKVYKTIAETLCQRLRETNEILIQIH
jgi:CRP-like cAMP-binding protein